MRKTVLSLLIVTALVVAMPTAALADDEPDIAELKKKAEEGDASAQGDLGFFYFFGVRVVRDHSEAAKWLRKSADQERAEAQCLLGNLYYRGPGMAQPYIEAFNLWRKAAAKGFARAQVNVGRAYADGKIVSRDIAVAVQWWRKAAEQGDSSAQSKLEFATYQGRALPDIRLYREAAKGGHVEAQICLGDAYAHGEGAPLDKVIGASWYRKAAESGHAEAQFILGLCYLYGDGVPKDVTLAYGWLTLSAADGLHGWAKKLRDMLELDISRAEVADGQRFAREWVTKPEQPERGPSDEILAIRQAAAKLAKQHRAIEADLRAVNESIRLNGQRPSIDPRIEKTIETLSRRVDEVSSELRIGRNVCLALLITILILGFLIAGTRS